MNKGTGAWKTTVHDPVSAPTAVFKAGQSLGVKGDGHKSAMISQANSKTPTAGGTTAKEYKAPEN